ncbi:hypothetical protein Hanom_Chr01g00014881 [Helianthus anomalus]
MASKKDSSAAHKSFLACHKKLAYLLNASASFGSIFVAFLKYSSALFLSHKFGVHLIVMKSNIFGVHLIKSYVVNVILVFLVDSFYKFSPKV